MLSFVYLMNVQLCVAPSVHIHCVLRCSCRRCILSLRVSRHTDTSQLLGLPTRCPSHSEHRPQSGPRARQNRGTLLDVGI